MKPISFSMKGTEYALTLKVSTYPEGNLAIKLYQESFGQLVFWDSLTVNLGGLCPKDCGYINIRSAGKRFYTWIKRNGLGERTGQVRLEDGVEYVEYLFNAKKLKKLDPEGYTYYERRLKGELGRRYERLYQALRRLANYPHCGSRPKIRHITGASLLSSAESSCGLRSQTATPILRGAVCIAAGRIWPPICWRCFRTSCPLLSPGPKPAAEKATQGMTRLLLRHSKKQPKPASGQQ